MDQLIDSQAESKDILPSLETNPQLQVSTTRISFSNIAKLGFHQIFYQKNDRLVVTRFENLSKNHGLNSFNALKQTYEKGVKKFRQANTADDNQTIPKKRRRGYSIDTETSGAYYLNNWVSSQEYPCQKPALEDKSAILIYQILNQQWTKTLDLVASFQRTPEFITLQFILKGFKAIQNILNEESQSFCEHFMHRHNHEINYKSSAESVSGNATFVNILEENYLAKFLEIKSLPKKVQCLRLNLQFLVNFAGKYEVSGSDDYIKLAFSLLGNSVDQEDSYMPPNKDFTKILLQLDIKLPDRLNFATKLISEKKRRALCSEMHEKLSQFSGLDNILFYLYQIQKVKQERIQQICRCYLDKFSDLETIAGLSSEFPFLKKYYYQYRQMLQFSNQHKQIERLNNNVWGHDKAALKETYVSKKIKNNLSFFDYLNISEEKFVEPKDFTDYFNICQICSKKMHKSQNFLECGKCRHGGHISHLLKWFQESENCPHIGCSCRCN